MKVYTLSGLDGAGKSTHAKKIKEYLENQGQKVFEFHIITFAFSQVLHRYYKKCCKKSSLATDQPAVKIQNSVTQAGFWGLQLRKLFLLIDAGRWHCLKKRLAKQGFTAVVSDRFFYDTLINIFYLEKNSPTHSFLENFIPRADEAVYLAAEPEDIMRHDRIPDQGQDYLEKKKALYEKKYATWKLKKVTVAPTKEETFAQLKSALEID